MVTFIIARVKGPD